jgi:hypothetical protein
MHSSFRVSSRSNPCPICGRIKDGDCRIAQDGSLVLCHHNFGDICPDGWRYVKPSKDQRTGIFIKDHPKTARPIGTTRHQYRYFDRDGTATAVRRYDSQGKKTYKAPAGVKSADLMPYRWEEAVNSPEVFIAEGELDVDALIARGLKAISCRLWTDRHAELLKGKTAIIIPDCDSEGLKKATNTAELLTKHGITVKWCCLPRIGNWEYPKPKDGLGSYDFFQLGGTTQELRQAIADHPLFTLEVASTLPVTVGKQEKTASVFELLMEIVKSLNPYKQGNEFGDTFVDVIVKGVRQTYRLRSSDFKSWLTRELYRCYQKSASNEALENCLKICEAEAMVTGNIKQVWLKTAYHENKFYIDLCNDKWQAIEVSKQGWRIVESQDLPVRFVRSAIQEPLPIPTQGGDLSKLWELLPVAEESKPLVTAWILSCLVATGEKPILVLSAPKGSGKSTIAKFLVNLIDRTKSALLPAVGNRRSLAVQSKHRWVFAYDNLSHLSVDQQDAICCASTGAGYMERKLFTDDEVVHVAYTRPQILTSVDLVPTRSDLLDRCLLVKLRPIPETDRKSTEELDQLFDSYHAEILGAFLTLLSVAIQNLDNLKQPLQRMASFHKLGLAAGIEGFNDAYLASIGNAQAEAVRVNPIADAIAEVGDFAGTAEELLAKLKAISDDPKVQKLTSRTLGRLLNSTLKPDLEAIGVEVDSYRESNVTRTRKILITRTDRYGNLMSETSKTSKAGVEPAQNKAFESGHQSDIKDNAGNLMSDKCPASEPAQDKASKPRLDNMDVMDIKIDHVSVDPENEEEW